MVLPLVNVSLKERVWLRMSNLVLQLAPQFLIIGTHVLVPDPLIHALFISPLPATLDIITMLKFDCPFNDGDDAFVGLSGDAEESGQGHVEVVAGGVAPAAVAVGGTEVGGGDGDKGAGGEAPFGRRPVVAPHLVARAACFPVSEQRRAQRRRSLELVAGAKVCPNFQEEGTKRLEGHGLHWSTLVLKERVTFCKDLGTTPSLASGDAAGKGKDMSKVVAGESHQPPLPLVDRSVRDVTKRRVGAPLGAAL
nr:hypothetical protein GW17_00036925 [Ipomoea batatas]